MKLDVRRSTRSKLAKTEVSAVFVLPLGVPKAVRAIRSLVF